MLWVAGWSPRSSTAYYASPAGTPGNDGSRARPWDLATALGGARGMVQPGDTIWLRGGISLMSADGYRYEVRNRMTICRCGASKNKPFCDGSHNAAGFQADGV